jgi:hypothetical protein
MQTMDYVVGVSPDEYDFTLTSFDAIKIKINTSGYLNQTNVSSVNWSRTIILHNNSKAENWIVWSSQANQTINASLLVNYINTDSVIITDGYTITKWNTSSMQTMDYVVGVSPDEYDFTINFGDVIKCKVANGGTFDVP